MTIMIVKCKRVLRCKILVESTDELALPISYNNDTFGGVVKQVDVLPSKNQALCDLIYNVLYISNLLLMDKSCE